MGLLSCLLVQIGTTLHVAYLWRLYNCDSAVKVIMAYPVVICCVVEEGVRCGCVAGCTTFDKRWLKSVSQRRQRYLADSEVSYSSSVKIRLFTQNNG